VKTPTRYLIGSLALCALSVALNVWLLTRPPPAVPPPSPAGEGQVAAPPERKPQKPQVDLDEAFSMAVRHLASVSDIEVSKLPTDCEIRVRRKEKENEWSFLFTWMPARPGGYTIVIVSDAREVRVIPGL
jgi:hypothetical protein